MPIQSHKSILKEGTSQTKSNNSQKHVQVDELLTIAEVAAYLKLSRRTAWRWCKSGRLPAIKIGHQWRIARSDLDTFIHRHGKLVISS